MAAASLTTQYQDTTYGYDANGNQLWVKDALEHETAYEYDSMNRRTVTRFPAMSGESSKLRSTVYDPLGQRVQEIDEAGVATAFGYDAMGRLTSVTNDFKAYTKDEIPVVTAYAYDEFGNQTAQTDANSHTTRYEFDALGRRTYRILPGAAYGDTDNEKLTDGTWNPRVEKTVYNSVTTGGYLQKQVTDFRGRKIVLDFDELGRLTASTPASTDVNGQGILQAQRTAVTYSYTDSGQRARVVQSGGSTRTARYAYDSLGRLRVKDSPEGTLSYVYDDHTGDLTRISTRYKYTWPNDRPETFVPGNLV